MCCSLKHGIETKAAKYRRTAKRFARNSDFLFTPEGLAQCVLSAFENALSLLWEIFAGAIDVEI